MTQTQEIPFQEPRLEEMAAKRIAGIEAHYKGGDMSGVQAQWEKLGASGDVPGKQGAAHYGVCHSLKSEGMRYLCGVEMPAQAEAPFADWALIDLPAARYAIFDHKGHVAELRQTIHAIWENWLPRSGLAFADDAELFFEKYGTDFDPLSGTGRIEIWIPVL